MIFKELLITFKYIKERVVMITMIYLSMRKSNIKRGMAQIEVNIIN